MSATFPNNVECAFSAWRGDYLCTNPKGHTGYCKQMISGEVCDKYEPDIKDLEIVPGGETCAKENYCL